MAAVEEAAADEAIRLINIIAAEPEVGRIYDGKVVKIMEFGAFVNYLGSRDALVHISQIAPHRVAKVTDVINVGDVVKVS